MDKQAATEVTTVRAIAIFGDMIDSRAWPRATEHLDHLISRLNETLGVDLLAPFNRVLGDEIQGLLKPHASLFDPLLRTTLNTPALPAEGKLRPRPIRWAIAYGPVYEGSGSADKWNGPALWRARELMDALKVAHAAFGPLADRFHTETGDPEIDERLNHLAPPFLEWAQELTPPMRIVVEALAVDGANLGPTELVRKVTQTGLPITKQAISLFLRGRMARAMLRVLPVIRADLSHVARPR